jgi:hypothetical protein
MFGRQSVYMCALLDVRAVGGGLRLSIMSVMLNFPSRLQYLLLLLSLFYQMLHNTVLEFLQNIQLADSRLT